MTGPNPGDLRVVAVRFHEQVYQPVASLHQHITAVQLEDGTTVDAAEVIRQIDTHEGEGHWVMIPPPGAPAYEKFMETGFPLLLQHGPCLVCGEEVLFA